MNQEEAELHMLNSQAQAIAEQLERIDDGLMEIEYLKSSLDELKSSKKGSDIFAPMSSGIFVKAKLEENEKLLVNVGNNVVVEKTANETKSLLDERISEMNESKAKLLGHMQKIEQRLVAIGEK